jgi:hypothetical protein
MIVILKLKNGIEVIGTVVSADARGWDVANPFIINYRFVAGHPMPTISVSRYIPFAADHQHKFSKQDVMHHTTPSKAFASYYQKSLEYCEQHIDKNVDEDLNDIADRTPASDEDMSSVYKSILERTQFDGPLN